MSAPPPFTVKVPLLKLALPLCPGPPMSTSAQPVGKLPVTFTLSKLEVFRVVLLCAVTAKPTVALLGIVTGIEPTCIQFNPSADATPVKVFAERTSRTQYGAATPAICANCTVNPPVADRYCMFTPCPGVK